MSDSDRRPGSPAISLLNLARALKLIALLLFVLPWVTVSCADQTLVSMSGLDLATGSVTAHNPITGQTARPPGSNQPDIPVLVAALLIAAALILSILARRRQMALASIAALAASAALIAYTVLIRLPEKARAGVTEQGLEAAAGPQMIDRAQILQLIRVEPAAGFWLTLAALLGAIVAAWMAQRPLPPCRSPTPC